MEEANTPNSQNSSLTTRGFYLDALPKGPDMEANERACPGAGDRIISLFEKQQAHDNRISNRQQIFGMVIKSLSIIIGLFLIYTKHEVIGGITAGTAAPFKSILNCITNLPAKIRGG